MTEWSKVHAWKVCVLQKGTKGSNPFLSAINANYFCLCYYQNIGRQIVSILENI